MEILSTITGPNVYSEILREKTEANKDDKIGGKVIIAAMILLVLYMFAYGGSNTTWTLFFILVGLAVLYNRIDEQNDEIKSLQAKIQDEKEKLATEKRIENKFWENKK